MYQEIQSTNTEHIIIIAIYFSFLVLILSYCKVQRCLVKYLGKVTCHKCIRINNHEHTDLQEYIGMYTTGTDGTLSFHEGQCIHL